MQKTIAVLYLNKESRATQSLKNWIAKNIDEINKNYKIKPIYVDATMVAKLQAEGIKYSPALLIKNNVTYDMRIICNTLMASDQHEPEDDNEFLEKYQMNEMINGEDEDDEVDPEIAKKRVQQKMAAMQKRRPEMVGMNESSDNSSKYVPGGKKIITKSKATKEDYKDDDSFLNAIGNRAEPHRYSDTSAEGEWEQYKNDFADENGTRVFTKPLRKPKI